jgi:hypothetical protein
MPAIYRKFCLANNNYNNFRKSGVIAVAPHIGVRIQEVGLLFSIAAPVGYPKI